MVGKYLKDHKMIAIFEPLVNPIQMDHPMGPSAVISKHSVDMKFTYVDKRYAIQCDRISRRYFDQQKVSYPHSIILLSLVVVY